MEIPEMIAVFVAQAIQSGHFVLPLHYPELSRFEDLQWFKDLDAPADGRWQPGWQVIALNGHDDPFFVDFDEADLQYPVYYCSHDAGKWEAIKIAERIQHFTQLLTDLHNLQYDNEGTLRYLETHVNLENELWKEVYANEKEPYQPEEEIIQIDQSQLINGKVIITAIGPNKLKIVQWLKERFDLSPPEALAMSKQETIEVADGLLYHLKQIIEQLEHMGATAQFIPNAQLEP